MLTISFIYFRQGKCLKGTYGGCGGNGNNFSTKNKCKIACSPHVSSSTYTGPQQHFDGGSFIGGIIFVFGITILSFSAYKYWKARKNDNQFVYIGIDDSSI